MKVLESSAGNGWKQNYSCSNCSSLLEVNAADLHGNPKETATALYFVCPVCESRSWLAKNGLPLDVVIAVFDREAKVALLDVAEDSAVAATLAAGVAMAAEMAGEDAADDDSPCDGAQPVVG